MKLFHIYVNYDLQQSFKCFVWRLEEDYILRLGGIQLKLDGDQKLAVNPIYYPLFSWVSKPGSWEFALYLGKISYRVIWADGCLSLYKGSNLEIEERE